MVRQNYSASQFSIDFAKKTIANESYTDKDGVIRYQSNNCVAIDEVLFHAGIDMATRLKCDEVRTREDAAFISEYKSWREKTPYSSEEMYEMRAAFGPGATVVDVVTGKRVTL